MHLKKCIISNILHRTAVVFAGGGLPFLPNLAHLSPPPWPPSAPLKSCFPKEVIPFGGERPLMRLAGKKNLFGD